MGQLDFLEVFNKGIPRAADLLQVSGLLVLKPGGVHLFMANPSLQFQLVKETHENHHSCCGIDISFGAIMDMSVLSPENPGMYPFVYGQREVAVSLQGVDQDGAVHSLYPAMWGLGIVGGAFTRLGCDKKICAPSRETILGAAAEPGPTAGAVPVREVWLWRRDATGVRGSGP